MKPPSSRELWEATKAFHANTYQMQDESHGMVPRRTPAVLAARLQGSLNDCNPCPPYRDVAIISASDATSICQLLLSHDALVAALRAIVKITVGSQPKDYPGALMVAQSALKAIDHDL